MVAQPRTIFRCSKARKSRNAVSHFRDSFLYCEARDQTGTTFRSVRQSRLTQQASTTFRHAGFAMEMTAAEILQTARPPADDGGIDEALADLDVKIWTWTDAMISAQSAMRQMASEQAALSGSFVHRKPVDVDRQVYGSAPPAPGGAPSANSGEWRPTYVGGGGPEPAAPAATAWEQAAQWPASGAGTPAAGPAPAWPGAAEQPAWATSGAPATTTAAASSTAGWPGWSATGDAGSASGSTARKIPAPKVAKKAPKPEPLGPTPEELAERAAQEEARIGSLDEKTARRVRLLRRLDPETDLERLIEKASQGQAEPEKDDKTSWWRRK
jgi:hypothetical protein